MTVRELIKLLLEQDMENEVFYGGERVKEIETVGQTTWLENDSNDI
jgi:hypothetical protein